MEGNLRRRNGEGMLKRGRGRCVEDRKGAEEILHAKINVKLAVSGYVQAERKQKYTPKNTLQLRSTAGERRTKGGKNP